MLIIIISPEIKNQMIFVFLNFHKIESKYHYLGLIIDKLSSNQ